MGPHKSTGNMSWPISWAKTETQADSSMGPCKDTCRISWIVAWATTGALELFFWAAPWTHTKTLATFLGQLAGPRQEHQHQFLGTFMGPHRDTGKISWAFSWTNTGMLALFSWVHTKALATFLGQLPGPRQEHQHQYFSSSMGPHKDTCRIS